MNPLYPEIVPHTSPRGRVSSPHHEIHTGRFSTAGSLATTDERRLRLGSIKLFTKILHRASPHGTRYFSYLNRLLVVSRSKYFYPKESSTWTSEDEKAEFPKRLAASCVRRGCIFQRYTRMFPGQPEAQVLRHICVTS